MGVSGLFAFLRRKYPEIVDACAQQPEEVAEGESATDNLYLDLNHIIHARLLPCIFIVCCCHGQFQHAAGTCAPCGWRVS